MAEEATNIQGLVLVSNVSSMHKTLRLNLKCQSQFTEFKETSRFIWNFFFSWLLSLDDNDRVQLQQHSRDNIKIWSEVVIWKIQ